MKALLVITFVSLSSALSAQDKKTISYRQWQDMPQDTYVRIMHTADSLLEEYEEVPFNFERKDGSCCLRGLLVIKEFYSRALIEKPDDEDAVSKMKEVDNLIEDEQLLYEEKHFEKILKKGDYYFVEGRFERALLFYERAKELSPTTKSVKKKIKSAKKMMKKYKAI